MDEAIAVLRAAIDRARTEKQLGPDVQLALKALRFTGVPAEGIRYFWQVCGSDNEIGRTQNMNAALNHIELFRSGKLPRA
jgi:hypothetical protein